MQYKFVKEDGDYSDLASGRVFHSLAGHPAFPVRLASEILQRCQAIRVANGAVNAAVLYDPCCGAGYHLSVLAYLYREIFSEVIGSDVDERAVTLAGQNLSLLNLDGLDKRIAQLEQLFAQYGKPSHSEALASAVRMRQRVQAFPPLNTYTFCASVLDADALAAGLRGGKADIVFTDIPYGQHSQWQGAESDPVQTMLTGLLRVLSPVSVVAVSSDKQQKVSHAQYQRIEHFQIGKRRIVILRPME
jgi:tRNA G10  N-methylase Trm11